MTKLSKTELRNLVLKAFTASDNTVKVLSGDDNPQVVEMVNKAKGKRDAYSAVFDALVGCDDPLRCDSYR
jgi:hypothetical protein